MLFSQAETVHTMAEESRAQGTIGMSLYVKYLRAGASIVFLLMVILVNLLAQVLKPLWDTSKTKCETEVYSLCP